ncbi:UNVERIFIED_CONTAM: Translocation protein S62, partial [Gekko kuhli]
MQPLQSSTPHPQPSRVAQKNLMLIKCCYKEVGEPFKEEKAVAKYLRFNCPTKSTNMMGHRVDYFIASKAVDCLLDSKWAKAKKGEEALFTTRESVVDYCN